MQILWDYLHDPYIVVGFVLCLVVAGPYVGLPIIVKSMMKNKAVPELVEFDPEANPPPRDVDAFFARTIRELRPEGFSVACHIIVPQQIPNVNALLMVLENRTKRDLALTVVMFGSHKTEEGTTVRMQSQHVQFGAEFVDGMEINTTNSGVESAFAPVPNKRHFCFPEVQNAAALYRIHQRALQEFAGVERRPVPASDNMLQTLQAEMIAEMANQVGTGYLTLNADGSYFFPTWKGAFLMSWKQVWPVKAIRSAIRVRRARRLMAQWGMSDLLAS